MTLNDLLQYFYFINNVDEFPGIAIFVKRTHNHIKCIIGR